MLFSLTPILPGLSPVPRVSSRPPCAVLRCVCGGGDFPLSVFQSARCADQGTHEHGAAGGGAGQQDQGAAGALSPLSLFWDLLLRERRLCRGAGGWGYLGGEGNGGEGGEEGRSGRQLRAPCASHLQKAYMEIGFGWVCSFPPFLGLLSDQSASAFFALVSCATHLPPSFLPSRANASSAVRRPPPSPTGLAGPQRAHRGQV